MHVIEMAEIKLFLLLAIILVAQAIDNADKTKGLYMMLRNESTGFVSARQIIIVPTESESMAGLSLFDVGLGDCSKNVEILGFSTMDTVRQTYIGQFMGQPYFYAVNLSTKQVSHIPAQGGYDMYQCLSADTTTGNLIAIDSYSNHLNSIDVTNGNLTTLMNVSVLAGKLSSGHSFDSNNKVLYALSTDSGSSYTNVLFIIDIANKKISQHSVSAQYKLCGVSHDSQTQELFAMEYQAEFMNEYRDIRQPESSMTIHIGRINTQTWKFERLMNLTVPFYSNQFLTTYSSTHGWFVIAWPEPGYYPYVSNSNGILQVVDVKNSKIIYNEQVHGWNMRGKTGSGQNTILLLDLAFND